MFKWKDILICVLLIVCLCCSVTAALKTGVIVGPQGIQGVQGEKGEQGEQGPIGLTGPQGIQGETGAQGPQGIQGEKGDKGDVGATGRDGKDGKDGIDGKDGVDGKNGLTPYIGPDGNWYIGTENTGYAAREIVLATSNSELVNKQVGETTGLFMIYTLYEYEDGTIYGYLSADNTSYVIHLSGVPETRALYSLSGIITKKTENSIYITVIACEYSMKINLTSFGGCC